MKHMIDHTRLAAIAHGSSAIQADVLADFRRTNALDARSIREAARQDDFVRIGILAHRIKGASMMIGAVHCAETCSLVSMAGRASDRKAVEAALDFLEREMAELDVHLDAQLDMTGHATTVPAALAGPAASQEPPLLCSNLSFLVVEDHLFQRDLITRFLLRLGALEVRGFGDGGAALDALNARTADIMVLDLSMPGVDGMELMRMLSGSRHPISLILNSALSPSLMVSLIRIAKTYRVNLLGAVSKPLTQNNLAPLIADYRAGRADTAARQSTGDIH